MADGNPPQDTALFSKLLEMGRARHYQDPDSAIFYYRQIFDSPAADLSQYQGEIPGERKSYLEAVIKALNYTGNIYYFDDEYSRAETYYRRSLELAEAGGFNSLNAQALYDIGYIRYMSNLYPEALQLLNQSYGLYAEDHNKKGMFNVRHASGNVFRRLGNYAMADSCYRECMHIAEEMNDSSMMADVKLHAGILLCEQGNMEQGIVSFEDALGIYELSGDEKAVSTALLNIGVVLKMVKEYDKALAYILRSTSIEELLQQKSSLVVRYYNLADLYLDMGQNDKAFDYCRRIEPVAQEIGSRPFEAECDYIFGKYYYAAGNLGMANEYLEKASAKASKSLDKPLIVNILLVHAKTLLDLKNYSGSIGLGHKSYSIADELNLIPAQKEASALLAEAYEKIGDAPAALRWYKTTMVHSDSLSYYKQRQEINRIEASFNYEKKEKENELLRNKASLQEQKLRTRNIMTIALVTGVSLSLIIILLLMRKNRDAKLLYEQQQMITLQHLQEIEGELDGKKRELASKLLFLNQKNELISRLIKRLQEIQQSPDNNHDELVSIVNELRVDTPQSNWREFETQFTQVHPGFYQRLYEKHPELTSYEQRICAFLRMNLNTKEISAITGRSPKSIEVTRSRIRQKLNLKRDDNLSSFLAAV
jgi:tetratricopeptide (TPR) repeat protein